MHTFESSIMTGLEFWTGLDCQSISGGADWDTGLDWTGPASKFVEHMSTYMQEQADRLRGVLDELPLPSP